MRNIYKHLIITFTVLTFCVNPVLAATTIGRYLTVEDKPKAAQVDLLSQTIQVRFPQNIQTIGDALQYVLRYSGYSLADTTKQSPALKNTLTKPLPLIDRNFGPMPLKDALITLAGPAFSLLQDPLNREVNFSVKPSFNKYGRKNHETNV